MSRILNSNALAKIANEVGVEPIVIVAIEWYPPIGNAALTVMKYADKDLPGIPGKILSISDLDEVIKLDVGSSTASLTVTLDDTDGTIKALMNKYDIHKRPVYVYQYFAGLALTDSFEIFRGETNSPIIWSEGERTVTFDVYTRIYAYESGFAPEEGQFQYIPDSLVGLPWPMCFGSPIHVPATKVANVVTGTIMNLFGFPDATLPFKRDFALYMQAQLIISYNYYVALIDDICVNNQAAFNLQEEYAHFIVNSDGLKQVFEDLSIQVEGYNKQIDAKMALYMSETEGTSRATLKNTINTLKTQRNAASKDLHDLAVQKAQLKFKDREFHTRTQNLKHLRVTVVGQLRKKARAAQADYYQLVRMCDEITTGIQNQNTLDQNNTIVFTGTDFPQGTSEFIVNGLLFSGGMAGYDLTGIVPQANFTNIKTGPRLDSDVTAFWLDSSTPYSLLGMYLRLSNNRVVKVTEQVGLKVVCELPRKSRNQRFQRRKVDYKDTKAVKDAFHNLADGRLTGNESDDQIEEIANMPPRDLSPKILKILNGGNATVTLQLSRPSDKTETFATLDQTNSYIILVYDNQEITDKILFTDTAQAILDKILASTLSIDNNDLTVSVDDTYLANVLWKTITITFVSLMRRLAVFEQNVVDTSGQRMGCVNTVYKPTVTVASTIHLNTEDVKPNISIIVHGYFTLYCRGLQYNAQPTDTATSIYNGMVAVGLVKPGEVLITGGPIVDADIVITYASTYSAIFLDTNNITFTKSDNSAINIKNLKPGKTLGITLTTEGGTASEYTNGERQKLIDDAVDKNVNQPTIEKYRNALRTAIEQYRLAKVNGAVDQATQEAVFNAQSAFRAIALKIDQSNFVNDEAYRLISDSEFDLLFDLETLNYQEFINTLDEIIEEFPTDIDYEFTMADIDTNGNPITIREACVIILPNWLNWLNGLAPNPRYYETYLLPQTTQPFLGNIGNTITLAGNFQEKYVANILPSTVLAVYAKKNVDGLTRVIPVPTTYYEKNENEYFGWYNCTTITLAQPLSQIDQSWEEGLYVTLTSSVGPNVCDVIAFIVGRYTTLVCDSVTFAHVATLQANYPVNFARLQKENALQLCEDIAWQARCVIWIKESTVYIRYLSELPTSYKTLTQSDFEQASFNITFTPTEEIITKLNITWRQDYAASDPYTMTLRRNLYRYNEIVDSREIYIYNQRQLVYKSATFWSMRRGTSWKKVSFNTFHNNLDLETQDCITISRTDNAASTGDSLAIVEKATYNSETDTISITAWLPIISGQMTPYVFCYPMLVTDRYPLDSEVLVGDAGNPLNMQVPNNTNFTSGTLGQSPSRPIDFGTPNIGDVDDQLPNNPASAFGEITYPVVNEGVITFTVDLQSDIDNSDISFQHINAHKEGGAEVDYGPGPTWTGYCRVIEYVDTVINSDGSEVFHFKVQSSDGRQLDAYATNVITNTSQRIEALEGLNVVVTYDKHQAKYIFQPPILQPNVVVPSE